MHSVSAVAASKALRAWTSIIGGLGSVGGCFIAALLVGLTSNYVGFVAPKVALGSTILLMLLVLLWRPSGLYPVARR